LVVFGNAGIARLSVAAIPVEERDALIALYDATGGPTWTNNSGWLGPPGTECNWYGVGCWYGPVTVTFLNFSWNNLSGEIPPELGALKNLDHLFLSGNRLRGGIPVELGSLTNLAKLSLNSNQLCGPVPTEVQNLRYLCQGTNHYPCFLQNGLDIRWNGLYSTDENLRSFLTSKQVEGDWESTQTVAPTGFSAGNAAATSIELTWSPIDYTADGGRYRIIWGTKSGGPYFGSAETTNKFAFLLAVADLIPATTYYFRIQSETDQHDVNQNVVTSEWSDEITGATSTAQQQNPIPALNSTGLVFFVYVLGAIGYGLLSRN
jgi:hypothetical protein